jgi:hypothetical protein
MRLKKIIERPVEFFGITLDIGAISTPSKFWITAESDGEVYLNHDRPDIIFSYWDSYDSDLIANVEFDINDNWKECISEYEVDSNGIIMEVVE